MSDPLTLPIEIHTQAGELVASITEGGAETKNGRTVATITLHNGDLINVRNVQGGTAESPNLDLGAGDSGQHRGNVVLNYDVGNGVGIYDGREARIATFNWKNDRLIHSALPHRFHRGALVPDGHGGWRHLA